MSHKAIGGYFGWEFPSKTYPIPHEDGLFVNNGRSAMQLILQGIGKVTKLYIPYFTCDSVPQALDIIGIPYKKYHISNDLKMAEDIELLDDEYLMYTNYFGLMDRYCHELKDKYGDRLIVDNAQALYTDHIEGTHSIYSCRKFMGVPDGGIAVSKKAKDIDYLSVAAAYDTCGALLARAEDDIPTGYRLFKENDRSFREKGLERMSLISRKIMESVDHDEVVARRRKNFQYLHETLWKINRLEIPKMCDISCPLVYPFYTEAPHLRKKLIDNHIYIAQYWPGVQETCGSGSVEYKLTSHILPLPIDQRYTTEDMKRILSVII